jgi:hypothetical protein
VERYAFELLGSYRFEDEDSGARLHAALPARPSAQGG